MTKEYLEEILTEYGVAFTDSLADRLLKEFKPCEDAVSRKAVLDLVTTIQTDDGSGNEILEVVEADDIKRLPPVTPQPQITEGAYKQVMWERDTAIKQLNDLGYKFGEKIEPQGDTISRQAVERITWEEPTYSDPLNVLTEVRDKVRALPSSQPDIEAIRQEIEQEYEALHSMGYRNKDHTALSQSIGLVSALNIIDKHIQKGESE